jgi:hypothetical protein
MSEPQGSSAVALGRPVAGGEAPAPPTPWLDVPGLLESSIPRGAMGRWLLLLPPIGLLGLMTAVFLMLLSPGRALWLPLVALAALAVSAGAMMALSRLAAGVRGERQKVGQIDELITLRHFPPAGSGLIALLGRPMKLGQTRMLALIQLARVLMRYDRFDEAIEVADAVISDPHADPGTRFAVGCGRAMALLRAGRLYDAGEAISQLRREVSRLDDAVRRLSQDSGSPAEPSPIPTATEPLELADEHREETVTAAQSAAGVLGTMARKGIGFDSVALTLVELYRDIQTRHSAEALATVESKRTALRDGLGIRLADALALASLAARRLGKGEDSSRLWSEATCLLPESELLRRYPELREVAMPERATPRPGERPPVGAGAPANAGAALLDPL